MAMDSTVTVRYFAQFREQAQTDVETHTLPTGQPMSIALLFDEISARHGFTLGRGIVRAAINGSYVDWDHEVRPGDELVFIPPVAGG